MKDGQSAVVFSAIPRYSRCGDGQIVEAEVYFGWNIPHAAAAAQRFLSDEQSGERLGAAPTA